MVKVLPASSADQDLHSGLPGSAAEPGSADIAARLKIAVRAAGGNTAVANRSGILLGTLNRYLAGREMKAGAMIALAAATGVRLDWLATGDGPMKLGELPTPALAPARSARLGGHVNLDRLVYAYTGAVATTGGKDKRLTVQLTVLLYDQLVKAEEES